MQRSQCVDGAAGGSSPLLGTNRSLRPQTWRRDHAGLWPDITVEIGDEAVIVLHTEEPRPAGLRFLHLVARIEGLGAFMREAEGSAA